MKKERNHKACVRKQHVHIHSIGDDTQSPDIDLFAIVLLGNDLGCRMSNTTAKAMQVSTLIVPDMCCNSKVDEHNSRVLCMRTI